MDNCLLEDLQSSQVFKKVNSVGSTWKKFSILFAFGYESRRDFLKLLPQKPSGVEHLTLNWQAVGPDQTGSSPSLCKDSIQPQIPAATLVRLDIGKLGFDRLLDELPKFQRIETNHSKHGNLVQGAIYCFLVPLWFQKELEGLTFSNRAFHSYPTGCRCSRRRAILAKCWRSGCDSSISK